MPPAFPVLPLSSLSIQGGQCDPSAATSPASSMLNTMSLCSVRPSMAQASDVLKKMSPHETGSGTRSLCPKRAVRGAYGCWGMVRDMGLHVAALWMVSTSVSRRDLRAHTGSGSGGPKGDVVLCG